MADQHDPLACELIGAHEQLKSHRAGFLPQWEACAHYCQPEERVQGRGENSEGVEREKPVDATGIRSAQRLASGIHSNTIALGQDWFTLRASNEEVNKKPSVSKWVSNAARTTLKSIQNSNFSLATHETLIGYGTFGTGVLFSEYVGQGLQFCEYSILDCCIAENAAGRVDTLYRSYWFTAKQAVEEFGEEACSDKVREAAKDQKRCYEKFEFLHAVYPRTKRVRRRKDGKNKPFASVHIDVSNQKVCRESGYDSFPYAVPRFYKTGSESYGRSPAMMAMPDMRTLNKAISDYLDGVDMAINPPLFMKGDPEGVDLTPGAVNPVGPGDEMPVEYKTQLQFSAIEIIIERYSASVEAAFYVDLFLALQDRTNNMTAQEVIQRIDEKIQSISPVVSRLQSELFGAVVIRCVALLIENGQIPRPPEELVKDPKLEVSYTTRLDAKLAQVETENLLRAAQQIGIFYDVLTKYPELRAYFNVEKVIRSICKANNVPEDLLYSEADAAKHMKEMQQQQQAAAAQQAAVDKIKPVDLQRASDSGAPIEALDEAVTG